MARPDDERALIERAQRGDRAAFEALLRLHYDVMYRIAFKWCGNKADAEDITQNACIKLARSIGSFRFQSAFLSWLYPLVINVAKDWARAKPDATAPLDETREPAVEPDAEQRVFAREILALLGRLPEREREAIHLVFAQGLSHGQAAEIMSCRESTVSWYIHEARKKLQSFHAAGCRYG